MAYGCRFGIKRECDGCGACDEKPVIEDVFGDPIFDGDKYYDIDGEIICNDNLTRWAEEYLKRCEKDDF